MLQELIDTLQKSQSALKEFEQIKVELKAVEEKRDAYKKQLDAVMEDNASMVDIEELDTANENITALENRIEELTYNYEYEGIGRIYIRADNLSDQTKIENALNKIFTRK